MLASVPDALDGEDALEKYFAFYHDKSVVTYGIKGAPIEYDVLAKRVNLSGPYPSFTLSYMGVDLKPRITLKVPGLHNVRNALAAATVALRLGIFQDVIAAGLESFTGTGRRFERIGEADGVLIVDDYAHHPTEIRATLAAARSAYPERRLVAVFQPHLPSRTRDLMDDFADALTGADAIYVTDIYLAREQPIPGISSATLAAKVRERNPSLSVEYVADKNDLPSRLAADVRSGDLVLTMGAGDIRKAGEGLLEALTKERGKG
jgi:UDP-N-acetylmuramate--alanine ligase